jgi:hypothetical protein
MDGRAHCARQCANVTDMPRLEAACGIARAADEPAQHHGTERFAILQQFGVTAAVMAAFVGDEHDPPLTGAGHDGGAVG